METAGARDDDATGQMRDQLSLDCLQGRRVTVALVLRPSRLLAAVVHVAAKNVNAQISAVFSFERPGQPEQYAFIGFRITRRIGRTRALGCAKLDVVAEI